MEELSKKKKKHNHKLTDILKVSIFSIVMLAPFLAVLMKCLYSLNPNAKESYYGETLNNKTYTEVSINSLTIGKKYTFSNDLVSYTGETTTTVIYAENISNINPIPNFDTSNLSNFRLRTASTNITYIYFATNDGIIGSFDLNNVEVSFDFELTGLSLGNNTDRYSFFYKVEYNKNSYIDNAFYYSIEQLNDEPVFNWAKNTGIYNVIDAMTTGLEMNSTVALLLSYWSICTAVYIIFDIVIWSFTRITHFLEE